MKGVSLCQEKDLQLGGILRRAAKYLVLLDQVRYVPPAEFEKAYYRQQEELADAA